MDSSAAASVALNRNKKTTTNTTICASFLKTVCLSDWWLTKIDAESKERVLGVGGFAARETQVIRAFRSTAIVKRHDKVTLETADGITITITGFINRSLTLENGFPSEVCDHFLFGFPYNWEEYTDRCFGEGSHGRSSPPKTSRLDGFDMSSEDHTGSSIPITLDDLPVTIVRDLFISSHGDSGNCVLAKTILNSLLQEYGGNGFKPDEAPFQSNMQSNCMETNRKSVPVGSASKSNGNGLNPLTSEDCIRDGTPKKDDRQEIKNADGFLHSTDIGIEGYDKTIPECEMHRVVNSSRSRITTRSVTRLKNSRNKPKNNLSPITAVAHRLAEPLSAPDPTLHLFEETVERGNASRVTHATIFPDPEVGAHKSPDKSAVRRYKRRKNLTRGNASSVSRATILPDSEAEGNQSPDNPAVRRSTRRTTMITGNASTVSPATVVSDSEMEGNESPNHSAIRRCTPRKTLIRGNASRVSHATITSDLEVEAKESPNNSAVRRSTARNSSDPKFSSDASKKHTIAVPVRRSSRLRNIKR